MARQKKAYDPETYTKKSGSKWMMDKRGVPCITGWWRHPKHGMIKLIANPVTGKGKTQNGKKRQTECTTARGETREVWFAKLQKEFQEEVKCSAFYDPITGKLGIPEYNLVAATKANNGGYFGTRIKKKYEK